eukprot:gene7630-8432_t
MSRSSQTVQSIQESLFWEVSGQAVLQGRLLRRNERSRKDFWREEWVVLTNNALWYFPFPGEGTDPGSHVVNTSAPVVYDFALFHSISPHFMDATTFSITFHHHNEVDYTQDCFRGRQALEAKKWMEALAYMFEPRLSMQQTPYMVQRDDTNRILASIDSVIGDYARLSAVDCIDQAERRYRTFEGVLQTPSLHDCFRKFIRERSAERLLMFWEYAEDYRRGHPKSTRPYVTSSFSSQARCPSGGDRAWELAIRQTFFGLHSPYRLPTFIEEKSQLGEGPDAFVGAQRQVLRVLGGFYSALRAQPSFLRACLQMHLTKRTQWNKRKPLSTKTETTVRSRFFGFLSSSGPFNFSASSTNSREGALVSTPASSSGFTQELNDLRETLLRDSRALRSLPIWWWQNDVCHSDIDPLEDRENDLHLSISLDAEGQSSLADYEGNNASWLSVSVGDLIRPYIERRNDEELTTETFVEEEDEHLGTMRDSSGNWDDRYNSDLPSFQRDLVKMQKQLLSAAEPPDSVAIFSQAVSSTLRSSRAVLISTVSLVYFPRPSKQRNSSYFKPAPRLSFDTNSAATSSVENGHFEARESYSSKSAFSISGSDIIFVEGRDGNQAVVPGLGSGPGQPVRLLAIATMALGMSSLFLLDHATSRILKYFRLSEVARLGPSSRSPLAMDLIDDEGACWQLFPEAADEVDRQLLRDRWLQTLWCLCRPPAASVFTVVKRGLLQKKGQVYTSFRPRLFELGSDLKLRYYKSDNLSSYQGHIDLLLLDRFTMAKKGDVTRFDQLICLSMNRLNRLWVLKASSDAEAEAWLVALDDLLRLWGPKGRLANNSSLRGESTWSDEEGDADEEEGEEEEGEEEGDRLDNRDSLLSR